MRVETVGTATLYLADCYSVLPTLPKVDALITDPPYGIGERMQGGTWGAAEKYSDFRSWDVAPSAGQIETILASAEKSIMWGGNYFTMPPARCWLVWDKRNAVPTMADCELAWTNLDKPTKRFSWPVGVHEYGHPTEKPVCLMEWCVLQAGESLIIVDPFMGTGTTGVACANLGRKFIGIEIEPKYFDVACERVHAAHAQMRLFA